MYTLKLECSSTIATSVKSHHLLIRVETLAWVHDVIVGFVVTLSVPLLQTFMTGHAVLIPETTRECDQWCGEAADYRLGRKTYGKRQWSVWSSRFKWRYCVIFGDVFWLRLVALQAAGVRKLPELVLCCVQMGNIVDKHELLMRQHRYRLSMTVSS